MSAKKEKSPWVKVGIYLLYIAVFGISLVVLTHVLCIEPQIAVWLLLIILVPLVLVSFPFVDELLKRTNKISAWGVDIVFNQIEDSFNSDLENIFDIHFDDYQNAKSTMPNFIYFFKDKINTPEEIIFKLDKARLDKYYLPMIYFQLKMLSMFMNVGVILIVNSGKNRISRKIKGTVSINTIIEKIEAKYKNAESLFIKSVFVSDQDNINARDRKKIINEIDNLWLEFNTIITQDNSHFSDSKGIPEDVFNDLFIRDLTRCVIKLPINSSDSRKLLMAINSKTPVIFIDKCSNKYIVKSACSFGILLSKSLLMHIGKIDTSSKEKS